MTITIDLSTVPAACWWYLGGVVYLLLSYLVFGPLVSRGYHRRHRGEFMAKDEAVMLWLSSPISTPIYVVLTLTLPVFGWLILGRDEK